MTHLDIRGKPLCVYVGAVSRLEATVSRPLTGHLGGNPTRALGAVDLMTSTARFVVSSIENGDILR